MQAVRFYGAGKVRVEDVPLPACGPGEALVKVAYAGICGSDLHVYRKGMFVSDVPVTMGHEFSGTVIEVGDGVSSLSPGDQVIGDPRVSCGSCPWCLEGSYNLCPGLGFIGEVAPGCLAEYIVMKADRLLRVPGHVSFKAAALAEPLAVALSIARAGGFSEKDRVGIIGAGPIGLLTLMVAKAMGVRQVAVVDLAAARLELAGKLGADSTLKTIPESLAGGMNVVVEAVGAGATLNGALRWLKPRGRLVLAGIYEEKVLFDPNPIVAREIRVAGIHAYSTGDLQRAIELLGGGALEVEAVVSHVLPLSQGPSAFDMLTAGDKTASKILLTAGQ